MSQPATPAEVIQRLLERKRRTLSRYTEVPLSTESPYDAVTKAVKIAEAKGAIDALEEAMLELVGLPEQGMVEGCSDCHDGTCQRGVGS